MKRIVIKRNGQEEPFKTQKIINAIFTIIGGLPVEDDYEIVYQVMRELELKVPERVTTEELDYLVLKAIEQLIPKHPIFDRLATRQLLKIVNLRVDRELPSFEAYVNFGVGEGLLKKDLLKFNLARLSDALNYDRDYNFEYFGLTMLKDRYLTKNREHIVVEKPQWFFMRVAMGIGLTEEEVIKIYGKLSNLEYMHSTPTLYNSGTSVSQYSSCYINVVDDSVESIMGKATETAFLAKYAGGVGTDMSRVRATGSMIRSLNAKSSGAIPFVKIFDTVINSIQQGGRRRSSQVIYMQPWHLDIEGFLDLRETTGNSYFRTPSLNTALWFPDEMLRRVRDNEDVYFFDPGECPELVEAWGADFAKKYNRRIVDAEEGRLDQWKKMSGRDFFTKYLYKLAKTGHPWLTFKDAFNRHNPCKNYSVINSSNLCTEIGIPNSTESTAVCTLASINMARHVKADGSDIDWTKLADTIRTMVQALDNILDKNFYPSEESRKNTMDLRPLGIGIMGWAEALVSLKIAYDSDAAVEVSRKLGQFLKEVGYAKSEELAKERGAFAHYDEMIKKGQPYEYAPRRNAVVLAIAPTASISILAGTTSSVDSYFSNIYSRDTLSGKFIVINNQLIDDLEKKGLWNEEMAAKIKSQQGSVQYIDDLDGKIDKDLYKTAYEIHPKRQIEIAAAFQESIDQAVSKSLYIDERYRDTQMTEIYLYAWEKELKSTYYCFIDKTVKGEKYTEKVNKRGERRGFGKSAVAGSSTEAAAVETQETDVAVEETPKDLNLTRAQIEQMDTAEVERLARAKYGDDVVEQVKRGDTESCPVDPLLNKICPSCE